jgi:hypothetical protein
MGNLSSIPRPGRYEVVPQQILEMREQLANMNWVTCPKCGYRWQYRGEGKAMMCSRCKWGKTDNKTDIENHKRFRKRQIQKGSCLQCPLPALKNTQSCAKHTKEGNASRLKRAKKNVSKGMCSNCGTRGLFTKWLCYLCNRKNILRMRRVNNSLHLNITEFMEQL